MSTARAASVATAPRIPPGGPAEIGRLNWMIARVLGAATGGGPPNFATTLARHRRLFRPWLRFAGALMPGGSLPRADTELLILDVAHHTGCEYEWRHHERLGQAAGLSPDDIARVRAGADAPGFSERQRLLLRASEELRHEHMISAETWGQLEAIMSPAQLIELCMLVGHYMMLAGALNSAGVRPDDLHEGPPPRVARFLQTIARRR